MRRVTQLTDRFDRALVYATHVHGGQVRKGTSTPYVAHFWVRSAGRRARSGAPRRCGKAQTIPAGRTAVPKRHDSALDRGNDAS